MLIRLAKPQDKEQILKLLDEFSALLKSEDVPSVIGGEMFDKMMDNDKIKIFVAEDNNKVIGTATLHLLPSIRHNYYAGQLEDFFVTQEMRRKGVGTALFEEIKNFCKKNNIKTLKLASGNELVDAHTFYENLGRKTTERFFHFDI